MTTLSKGDKGAAVAILQQLLNYRGADLKADGVFGAKTKRALTAFQSRSADALGKKPSPDGIAGPAT